MRKNALPAVIAAAVLAGCGGNGGSSSSSPSTGGSSPSQNQSQIAGAASDVAFSTSSGVEADQAASAKNVGILALIGRAAAKSFGNLPYGQCVPDGSYAGMELAAPQSSGSTTNYEITYYRDPACTQEARDIKIAVTKNGAGSYTVNRVATNFNSAGNQTTQRTTSIAVNGVKDNFTAQAASVLTYASGTAGSAMNEWTVAPGGTGVDTISGDGARVTNASTASYGASYAIGSNPQATKTLNADGSVTYAITTNSTAYSGAAGTLSIVPATFPGPFTDSPAADAVGSGSLTWNETFDPSGLPVNIAVSGTLAQGASLSITTAAGSPILFNGTVTGTGGNVLATFQVDQWGNGTLNVTGAAQRSIYDWHAFK